MLVQKNKMISWIRVSIVVVGVTIYMEVDGK